MKLNSLTAGFAGVVAASVTSVFARADGDISLMLSGNYIITTKVSEEGVPLGPERVFSGMLTNISGTWYTDEPGFQIEPATLNPGTNFGMYFTRSLREWDGSSFDATSSGRLNAAFGPPGNSIITPTTNQNSASLLFPVGGSGGLHDHPDWILENFNPGSDLNFFLIEARLSSNQPGVIDSAPFYVVFGVNANEDQLDAMENWVRTNVVPAPPGLSVAAMSGLICLRRRRA